MIGFGDALNLLGAVSGAVTGSNNDEPDTQQRPRPLGSNELQEAYNRCERAIRDHVPAGRQQSLALTNLEQSALWARAGIEGAQ